MEWYKTTSERLERENGKKIPSLMFQHIVIPEIWDALEAGDEQTEGSVGHNGRYYSLPAGAKGTLSESPCPPNYSNRQFDAVLERGDVMAMFFGHDHVNSYEFNYKGVDIVNTPGVGFCSYNSEEEGVRLITLDENKPNTYETELVTYFDLFDRNDPVALNLFLSDSSTVPDSEHFGYFMKYIFSVIKSVLPFCPPRRKRSAGILFSQNFFWRVIKQHCCLYTLQNRISRKSFQHLRFLFCSISL